MTRFQPLSSHLGTTSRKSAVDLASLMLAQELGYSMRMSLDEVRARTRDITQEFDQTLGVTQVIANDGESEHVELILTISGCHRDPCTVIVNVPRDNDTFEEALRARIHDALADHTGSTPQ